MTITLRVLSPCAARKFASQSERNQQQQQQQQRPRPPTIRRRLIAPKAVPPPTTERAANPCPSTPTSSSPPAAAPSSSLASSQPAIGAPELSLLLTAALWGSYAPALRFLFSLDAPPSPSTLTAARAVVQAALLAAFALVAASASSSSSSSSSAAASSPPPAPAVAAAAAAAAAAPIDPAPPLSPLSPLAKLMRTPSPTLLSAGAELGAWNLAAAALHAAGLSRTSATEAAFVVCATGLLTPLYAAAAGEKQGRRVWAGCGVALLGALALSLDKGGVFGGGGAAAATAGYSPSSLAGDGFVLCAAAFYSAATFRLSVLAPVHASGASGSSSSPQALAAAKSAAFAVGAVVWALSSGNLFSGADQGGLASLLPSSSVVVSGSSDGVESPTSFAAPLVLAWAAFGPGALAAFLQSKGQAQVAAGKAQALFATVPLWSAALAGIALGERTGAAGWAGGLLIVAGGALAATAPREE